MKSITQLKSFEITTEKAKKIKGGDTPTYAEQKCWEAQNWLSQNNIERCRVDCDEAGWYLDMERMFC